VLIEVCALRAPRRRRYGPLGRYANAIAPARESLALFALNPEER
jgi:hypothetical protein